MVAHSLPRDTFNIARTTEGSNWPPEQRMSSARASPAGIGALYDRADVMTSNASATQTIRDASAVSDPATPLG